MNSQSSKAYSLERPHACGLAADGLMASVRTRENRCRFLPSLTNYGLRLIMGLPHKSIFIRLTSSRFLEKRAKSPAQRSIQHS